MNTEGKILRKELTRVCINRQGIIKWLVTKDQDQCPRPRVSLPTRLLR